MKYRDKLSHPMAGPNLLRCFYARRITKGDEHSNPVYSEFHRILWCGFYNIMGQSLSGLLHYGFNSPLIVYYD